MKTGHHQFLVLEEHTSPSEQALARRTGPWTTPVGGFNAHLMEPGPTDQDLAITASFAVFWLVSRHRVPPTVLPPQQFLKLEAPMQWQTDDILSTTFSIGKPTLLVVNSVPTKRQQDVSKPEPN